ncbi:unnamed protein product [Prorocentrum cordatum]|uniref:Uncharacterized protein n=1 Tax=Prorocentrum cordatum TaxID=2364126 RepID=A0ABN9X9G0_9DINO|nr:unnamed protein product [Polarella glacialis]
MGEALTDACGPSVRFVFRGLEDSLHSAAADLDVALPSLLRLRVRCSAAPRSAPLASRTAAGACDAKTGPEASRSEGTELGIARARAFFLGEDHRRSHPGSSSNKICCVGG